MGGIDFVGYILFLCINLVQFINSFIYFFRGPEGTPYEGGLFTAHISYPQDYPHSPPKMRFVNKIFHPNSNNTLNLNTLKLIYCSNFNMS